ncbi:unnamed protein product [Schistocephalus solidus]|uniref:PHD-type domain-containing protein n=1 Tax=Schistocephalus solidus TaxID=70667 RepID=A0A183THL8_SCHSO|nr:unnamed protein product [Schistocephalus solidus]
MRWTETEPKSGRVPADCVRVPVGLYTSWELNGCLGLAKEPDAAQWFCPKCSGEPLPPPRPRPPVAVIPAASSPVHAPSSPHHSSGSRKAKISNAGTGTGSKRAKGATSAKKRSLL